MLVQTKQLPTLSTFERLNKVFSLQPTNEPIHSGAAKGSTAIRDLAKRLVDINCSVIPVYPIGSQREKTPRISSWVKYQKTCLTYREIDSLIWESIALVTGFQNVECIDYDSKNESGEPSLSEFKRIVSRKAPGLLKRLFVQRTPSGGLHFVYRCKEVHGSMKLASGKDNRTIWETRGKGGYILLSPSPGYQVLQSSFPLPWITIEERDILMSAARSFDQQSEGMSARVQKLSDQVTKKANHKPNADTRFDAFGWFQANADIGQMLIQNGWKAAFHSDNRRYYTRPGKDGKSGYSANVLDGILKVHSTSTEFDTSAGIGYNAVQVYCKLYHQDDMSAAARAIHAMMKKGGIEL